MVRALAQVAWVWVLVVVEAGRWCQPGLAGGLSASLQGLSLGCPGQGFPRARDQREGEGAGRRKPPKAKPQSS